MVIDHPIPFATGRRLVDKDDETRGLRALSGVCHLGKLLHELLQTVYLEGGAHDDQEVGTPPHVCGLYSADLVTQWVRLVIQDNGRPKRPDPQGTCRTCDSGLGWRVAVSTFMQREGCVQATHNARCNQDNRGGTLG